MRAVSVIFAFAVTASSPTSAQQVMDGSETEVDEGIIKAISATLLDAVADPYSVQISRLKIARDRPELVCGFINLKNSFGAYTGFQAFAFNTKYNNLLLQDLADCRL